MNTASWTLAQLALQAGAPGNGGSVTVTGPKSDEGQIGCGLLRSVDGFPMASAKAIVRWQSTSRAGVTCRFETLPSGPCAVPVSHDLNGNRKTDTNVIGLPREDWSVSRNVRPSMRAPRFGKARFNLEACSQARILVAVGR